MAQLKAGQAIVVVTSCLIHCKKGKILDFFLLLPYAFSMPCLLSRLATSLIALAWARNEVATPIVVLDLLTAEYKFKVGAWNN